MKILKSKRRNTSDRAYPFFIDGCETWCLLLREGHKLRVFEGGGRYVGLKGTSDNTVEQIA